MMIQKETNIGDEKRILVYTKRKKKLCHYFKVMANQTNTEVMIKNAQDVSLISDMPHPKGESWRLEDSEVERFNHLFQKASDIYAGYQGAEKMTFEESKEIIEMWWREKDPLPGFIAFVTEKINQGDIRVLFQ